MRREDEGGFTFVELLVVIVVLGIIMSAITSALITVIRTAGGTADRMSQSHDAQLLSTWLVPDLQSASGPTGIDVDEAPAPPAGGGDCAPSPPVKRLEKLTLSWTDAASGTGYTAIYAISPTWELTRTFSVDTLADPIVTEPTFTVVHNLEDPAPTQPLPPGATARYPVCIEQEPGGKVTLTVTTLINANAEKGSYQFTFSVAAQTRQPFAPPAPDTKGPPISGETETTNPDGRIDLIHVEFDQPVACVTNPCGTAEWSLTGAPGPVAIDAVTLGTDNRTATLAVSGADVDTAAVGMKVALAAGAMVGAGPTPAVLPPTDVTDGMSPILHKAISRDIDADGRLDKVALVFSETVTLTPGLSFYKLIGGPDGDVFPSGISGTGESYLLEFPPTNPVVDTLLAGAVLRISQGTALDGPRSNPTADVAVADGMAPFLTSLVADAGSADGRITRMTVTFTEPMSPSSTPTVDHNGSNVAMTSAPAGNSLVLTLGATAPVDTSTPLYSVSGTVSDASAGNTLVLNDETVVDDVGPRLLSVNTTVPGVTPGLIEFGDAVAFTFSEPLASIPASPITMTVTESGGGPNKIATFSLPGLASVVVKIGSATTYGTPSVSMTLTSTALTPTGGLVEAKVGTVTGAVFPAAPTEVTATAFSGLMDSQNNLVDPSGSSPTTAALF